MGNTGKVNCWQAKNCGREPGGKQIATLGVCSAAEEKKAGGIHGGVNGGRACWAIAGTLCGGKTQGSFANKLGTCRSCDFFKQVASEESVLKDNVDILYQIGYTVK